MLLHTSQPLPSFSAPAPSGDPLAALARLDLRRKWQIALGLNGFLVLWILVMPFGVTTLTTIANFALPLLGFWWCFRLGHRYRTSPPLAAHRDRPTLRRSVALLLGMGGFCYAAASGFYYYYAFTDQSFFPSTADYLYFAIYAFLIPGVLLMAREGTSVLARGRLLLDSLLTIVALATFTWYFLLGPMLEAGAGSLLETVLGAGYPVMGLIVLFCLLQVTGRMSASDARWVIGPLGLGVLVDVSTDMIWGYRVLHDLYVVGEMIDVGWPLGFSLIGLAGRAYRLAPFLAPAADTPRPTSANAAVLSRMPASWRALLPYALLPLVGALVIFNSMTQTDPWLAYGVYGGSTVLLVLLVIRQVVAIHESVSLNRHLQRAYQNLDASHRSLAETHAKLAAVNRVSLDGVMVVRGDGVVEEYNPAAAAQFGIDAGRGASLTLGQLLILPEAADAQLTNRGLPALAGLRLEATGVRPDGARFPLELAIAQVDWEGPALFVAFVHDLTARKQNEQERTELNHALMAASREAGMAEVATGVLHNVGNVLNSVNVSASLVGERIRHSELASLKRAGELIRQHLADLPDYITNDQRGRMLPAFLLEVTQALSVEQEVLLGEVQAMGQGVDHIRQIIDAQQAHARNGIFRERVSPRQLIDAALNMHRDSMARHDIRIACEIAADAPEWCLIDQHKVLQILINLISNAKHAIRDSGRPPGTGRISLGLSGGVDNHGPILRFTVSDNGMGIPPDLIERIFMHGFTTRHGGHGFGLHSGANLARELGGSLRATSAGAGCGATFILELPLALPAETEAMIAGSL